jgi:hypothetical protein
MQLQRHCRLHVPESVGESCLARAARKPAMMGRGEAEVAYAQCNWAGDSHEGPRRAVSRTRLTAPKASQLARQGC